MITTRPRVLPLTSSIAGLSCLPYLVSPGVSSRSWISFVVASRRRVSRRAAGRREGGVSPQSSPRSVPAGCSAKWSLRLRLQLPLRLRLWLRLQLPLRLWLRLQLPLRLWLRLRFRLQLRPGTCLSRPEGIHRRLADEGSSCDPPLRIDAELY